MASTSVSSVRKSFMYDVFLSFRGEDTRNSFVGHLYQALKQKGIDTYMDDKKIEQGEEINDQLMRSIQESRFFIIVFSKTYASSSWCLDELIKIIECQKTAEQTAYPVFFHVEPTEVRNQNGPVGEAFSKHENHETAGKWREAMKEACSLGGWELKTTVNGDESKLIKRIVDEIFRKLCSINLSIDGSLVGMEIRKKEVLSSLDIGTNDVRVIGIKGIGGGGKTTLAEAVYEQISTHFDGISFVENVREFSKTSLSGLKTLQEQILRDVFDDNISISGVFNGKKMIRKMMPRKKVLVVLDDVDHRKQLEALVDNFDNFKPGSRIIITTRDEQVLLSFGVRLICNVNLLTDEEAVCLFRRYAFGEEIPNEEFNEMSGQVVRYAAGLPLTIKVLGSSLLGKSKLEWEDALKRLKKVPEKETQVILKISYDALEDDYKEIFLDVACILKGEQKDKAIRVLESCGFNGRIGLRVLEQKCLINISQSGSLGMHDLIQEMGKHIVRRPDPNEPNRDSRLWIEGKTEDILDNDLVNERIRCIKLSHLELEFDTVMRGLRNKRKLRVLYMCSGANWNDNKDVSQRFPDSLQYLSWRSYPFKSLHETTFQADNLVGLDMSFSSIELILEWGKGKVLNKLRFLDLSYSNLKMLNLEVTPKLEILNLEHCANKELYIAHGCPKLQYLNLDFSNLKKLTLGATPDLETLSLGGCSNLTTLNLEVTPKLEVLNLEHCTNLEELHIPNACPKLQYLNLDFSKLSNLSLGPTPDLETLSLGGCSYLQQLHMPGCPKLKVLKLDVPELRTLNLGLTLDLETLSIEGCNLAELHMPSECPKLKFISFRNSKLRKLNLGLTPNLERLDLKDCSNLVDINAPDGCLEKLVYLDLSGCGRFKSFLFDKQSEPLKVGSLSELHLIGESIDICPLHPQNKLPKFVFTCSYKEDPASSSFGNLEKLISIGLCSCTNLESFSRSIYSLQCLEKFTLEGSIPEVSKDIQHSLDGFPVSIFQLKRLKYFHLLNCTPDDLPEELRYVQFQRGNTLNLKMLILEDCNHPLVHCHLQAESLDLEYLEVRNNPILLRTLKLGNTPNLEKLLLIGCNNLIELQMPAESLNLKYLEVSYSKLKTVQLGNTPNLEQLILEDCNNLIELQMPAESLNLKYLEVSYSKLKTVQLGNTPNLEQLILEGCIDLVEFEMPAQSLNLKYLDVSYSKLESVQLGNTPNLEKLLLIGCNNLIELQMPAQSLNLKYLDVSYSKLKLESVQLGNTPNLEKLLLIGCNNLIELQMPAESLNLKYLEVSYSKLKTVQLGNTPNLEQLILEGCIDLVEFEMPAQSLNLKYLDVSYSKLESVQLGNTPNLEKLLLIGCNNLIELQMPAESLNLKYLEVSYSKLKTVQLGNTPNLEQLILEGCIDLVEFEMPAQSLNLKYLDVSYSKLESVQLGNTPNLEKLLLIGCNNLIELQMPAESLNLKYLEVSYSKLKTVQLGNTPNLEQLILEGCIDLVEFEMPAQSLNLKYLDVSYSKLESVQLGNTPNLEKLLLIGCNNLIELQMPAESLNLKYLEVSYSKLKTVQLGNTPNLEQLILEDCNNLIELQMPAESLNLKYLEVSYSKLKTVQLGNTPNLEQLMLEGCIDLVEFEMPAQSLNLKYLDVSYSKSKLESVQLGNTPNLEKLLLIGCNNLIELQMPAESLNLKYLEVSYSKLETVQLGNTPNLEQLILEGCIDLVEFEMPAQSLNLKYLDLSRSKVKTVQLGNTPNLEKLLLIGCNNLIELQMPAESLNLKYLDASYSKLKTVQLKNTPNLEELILEGCTDLVEFEMSAESLNLQHLNLGHSKVKTIQLENTPNLKKLILRACTDLVEFQMPDKDVWLKDLDLSHSKLKTIQLRNTRYLEKLMLKGCNDLEELRMPLESPELLGINLSHSKIRTLHLGRTPKLRWLNLENCCDLVEINAPIGFLFKVTLLALSGCGRFKVFRFDKQFNVPNRLMKELDTRKSELHLIAETIDVCQLHPDNSFPKFRFECYYDEDQNSFVGNLEMLISMGLCACTNLESFSTSICSLKGLRKLTLEGSIPEIPRDLDQLECLEELIFSSSNIRNLPDSISRLKHLKSLELESCLLLEKLPDDLDRIESLDTINIIDCSRLRDVPNNIGKINVLTSYRADGSESELYRWVFD